MHLKTAGRIMIAGTLVLALAAQGVSGAVATGGEGSYYREKEHEQVSLADMDRKSFNEEEFRKAASELKQVCREEGQEDRVAELYAVVLDQTNRLSTVSALAMLDYYSDMNDDAAAESVEIVHFKTDRQTENLEIRQGPAVLQGNERFPCLLEDIFFYLISK